MTTYTATYSPDDNKLRLYASSRLDSETYARVKAAGFRWAPKQDLFVAPTWSPEREDLLIELAGEVEDEDKSLVERAEERAERFENYSENRAADASAAHKQVDAISEQFYMGQPILVGHHSEKGARKAKERMDNGMRRAIAMTDAADYWASRAKGAIAAAKYKERPDVRSRRIKGIVADKRKVEKYIAEWEAILKFWSRDGITLEEAKKFSNFYDKGGVMIGGERYWSAWGALEDGKITVEELRSQRLEGLPKAIERQERWIKHYENRLTYERAMLAEQIGVSDVAQRFDLKPGGKALVGREWLPIVRINKKDGAVVSVSTVAPSRMTWRSTAVFGVEEIQDYKAPTEEAAKAAKKASSKGPICNYPGEGFRHITREEWDKKHKDYKTTRVQKPTETTGLHRVRWAMFPGCVYAHVYITDEKRIDPPAPEKEPAPTLEREFEPAAVAPPAPKPEPRNPAVDAMRKVLREGGVQVAVAPTLFPTPQPLAERMVEIAGIKPGDRVLEPSAGTGQLVDVARRSVIGEIDVVAVEINLKLAQALQARYPSVSVIAADFLDMAAVELPFDVILMNPPFDKGADIRHIEYARQFLKPGGRIVALCANGPRQREKLQPIADLWEDLPAGSFKESGTNVNVALLVIEADSESVAPGLAGPGANRHDRRPESKP